jgi:site-specific recombinase XerD
MPGCSEITPQGNQFKGEWQAGRATVQGEVKMKEAKKVKGVFEKVVGSGVFWVRYADASGRIRREKVGTKSAASALYKKRKTEVLQGKKLPERFRVRAVLFTELAEDALEYSKVHKLSYDHDVYRMAKLKEAFGHHSAESITPQEVERWIANNKHWGPATANRYRALLSLAYRLGVQNGKVGQNPARLIRPRRENNVRVRWLTADEEKQLRDAIEVEGAEHLPELDIAIHTGLRRSEQYGLTWECVDLERQLLTVPQSKNGKTRHIALNSTALNAFLFLKRHSDGVGRVFKTVGPRGWFEPAVKRARLPDFTWHCLRHTFASRLVMAGVDLRTVQELMGHKTIAMTCRYAHLTSSHQHAAVERISGDVGFTPTATDTKTDTDHLSAATVGHRSVQ